MIFVKKNNGVNMYFYHLDLQFLFIFVGGDLKKTHKPTDLRSFDLKFFGNTL